MQRTTVRLPDDLLQAAKDRARATGRSLTQLLEDAIRDTLARPLNTTSARVSEPLVPYIVNRRAPIEQTDAGRAYIQAQVAELQDFIRSIPIRDTRTEGEILGYDEYGLPSNPE